jgi:Zn-dependent peptidase ImmA (M78 family)/transcriptional regulator with XRE-family HTH domain
MASVGQQILEQRRAFGFSSAEAAQLAGLSSSRVGELERGATPTVYEVTAVARALAIEPKALLHPSELLDAKRSVARFRAPLGVTSISPHDMRLLAKAAEVSRTCAYLLKEVGRDSSPIASARRIRPVYAQPEPWRQGYELGEQARERLVPDTKPIASVQGTFEALGIHVAFVTFDSKSIEAASLYEPNASPMILLNASSERVQREISRRAILAHELCHILHDGGERDLLAIISREEDHAPVEARANGFGPSFLAPQSSISVSGEEPKARVLQLAYGWGFTFEGAVWHAKNVRLISRDDAERLLQERRLTNVDPQFERTIARASTDSLCEPADVSPLTHGLLSDVAMRAYADGVITRARAREILTTR